MLGQGEEARRHHHDDSARSLLSQVRLGGIQEDGEVFGGEIWVERLGIRDDREDPKLRNASQARRLNIPTRPLENKAQGRSSRRNCTPHFFGAERFTQKRVHRRCITFSKSAQLQHALRPGFLPVSLRLVHRSPFRSVKSQPPNPPDAPPPPPAEKFRLPSELPSPFKKLFQNPPCFCAAAFFWSVPSVLFACPV